MEAELKKTLKAVTLELRHLLEGRYDQGGQWKPGDLEQRLAAIGVRRDRASVPVDELGHLAEEDRQARKVVDAYLKLRDEAGVERSEAVAEFVRETAYTWANRFLALRCMEARELIDSVILQQEAYGGRSLEHHRLAQRHPELCAGDDDGLFAVLDKVFRAQAGRLPMLFDPQAPGIALRPSAPALKDCFGLLSLNPDTLRKYRIRLTEDETASPGAKPPNPFTAPDALGWAYQYWNTEEKNRVFEKVRTVKGAKIAGADIIPATQLYTEDYMVKFLVQNSLGATWMGMHPDSKLAENWEYYVKDADRASVEKKPVREITFLDPACGSGHFHLEAFDLFYAMYQEEGELTGPEEICNAILTKNLFGIDIDPRAVQIAEAALWMKAAERTFDYKGAATNLVAATASHLKGEAWEEFLASFEREPSVARVLRRFAQTMEHIDEIGSLARPAEDLREIIEEEHATWERQVREKKEANYLFAEMNEDALSGQLPFQEISDEEFGNRLFYRAKVSIDAFTEDARASGEFEDQLLGNETRAGFRLVDLLGRRYEVIAANPPYMGTTQLSPPVAEAVNANANSPDLYCALMLRWLDLQSAGGIAGFVTRADYLTQAECEEMRRQLLERTTISLLVRLENRVFRDLSNPNAIFFSMQVHSVSHRDGTLIAHTCLTTSEYEGKADELRDLIKTGKVLPKTRQGAFERLPRNAFALNLPDWAYEAYEKHPRISEFAAARQGLITGDTSRFLRFRWEIPREGLRWHTYAKGGEFCRWFGNDHWCVDWEFDGVRLRNFVDPSTGKKRSRVQNTAYYGRRGLTWSSQTVSAFATRMLESSSIFDTTGSSVFLENGLASEGILYRFFAVLNSPAFGLLFRSIQPGVHYGEGYLETLPCPHPEGLTIDLELHAAECVALQKAVSILDSSSSQFVPTFQMRGASLATCAAANLRDSLRLQLRLYSTELNLWAIAESQLGVPEEAQTPTLRRAKVRRDQQFLPSVWSSSAAPTAEIQEATQNAVEEACLRTCGSPEAAFTEIEAIRASDVPRAVLTEWMAALVEPVILLLLGHLWPKQIEAGEPVPEWADPEGIISLTPMANESTLFDRVQQRLRAHEIDTSDFAEMMGKPLSAWLTTEFFKHHMKQFKKRPIAWQLQSGKFTARTSPAFACLLYYHKLDADTLPKLRSQYVGPLRQRLETELRGILAVTIETRSDRQEKRRAELDDAIHELTEFDAKLEQVARDGFATAGLKKLLEPELLDRWCSLDGKRPHPTTKAELITQESSYAPDINDGVRVNIAPLQKAGLLPADVLAKKDVDKAIADRAEWRADERRWVREGKLPQPGWWSQDMEPAAKVRGQG